MRFHVVIALAIAALAATSASAQTADTGIDTKKLERTTVKLFDKQPDVRGLLLGLTNDTVTVLVDSQRVEVPLTRVRRVDVGGDPVTNGAVIGGVVAGVWCALICGQGLSSRDSLAGAAFKAAGMGALLGLGIDAMDSGWHTIYRAPKDGRRASGLSPAFSVSFRF